MKIAVLFFLTMCGTAHSAQALQNNAKQPSHPSLLMLIHSWNCAEECLLEPFEDSRARIKTLQEAYERSSLDEKREYANMMIGIYTTWNYRCQQCAPDEATKVAAQCLLEQLKMDKCENSGKCGMYGLTK